nr:DsbC family protein [Trinickia violacea]
MPGCSMRDDGIISDLEATLRSRLGDEMTIRSVLKSPIAGLYEVDLGDRIIYSDATGDRLLVGEIFDSKNRSNLTESRFSEINKIDFSALPFSDALKVVRGNGSRKLAVFSDPNCPYCKQLEAELESIDNVTIYTFLYPVLSPDSVEKSRAIWCSPDRTQAWGDWMLDHRKPTTTNICKTDVIERNIALGHSLNVKGTPTVFLSDGRRLPGALSIEKLEQQLVVAVAAKKAE